MEKILVVDSDKGVRRLLNNFFTEQTKNRCEVTATDTAEGAQGEIQKASPPFNVVITGNWLEHQNRGTELTCWIKEHCPETLVILMSGLEEPDRHKADIFISKPFGIHQLEAAINQELAV